MSLPQPWFKAGPSVPDARVRLFCFPHAGAGASVYKDWGAAMAPHVEVVPVQLPGRETRSAEAAFVRMPALLDALLPVLTPHLDRPFAIYGHSLGALIGFELTRELRRRGLPLPLCLFVACRRAPQVRATRPALHAIPDDELAELLRQAGGTPAFMLELPKWRQYLLGLVRQDLELTETYVYAEEAPLPCPLFAFGGTEDRLVPLEDLEAWREQAGAGFALQLFPGGHIFHQQAAQAPAPGVPRGERPRTGNGPALLGVLSEHLLRVLGPAREAKDGAP